MRGGTMAGRGKRVVCYECRKAPGTLVQTPLGMHCQGSCNAQKVAASKRQLRFLDSIGNLTPEQAALLRRMILSGAFEKRARAVLADEEASLDRDP